MKKYMILMAVLLFAWFYFSKGFEPLCGQVTLEPVFPNLQFTRPVDLQTAPGIEGRFFVVEQQGLIYSIENNSETDIKQLFLDIRDRVNDSGNEQGLLGLAFHPDYQDNGTFFVDYTASNPNRTVIARYKVSTVNPDSANKSSESIILEVDQPFSNHNGGQIIFGPDHYLYITLGDGGSGGDPEGNGQNLETLLGSILRIDVDQKQTDFNYAIPQDNPFVLNLRGFREEIYAYGLRNPWRISFDPVTQQLWAADVGQDLYEEIDIIEKGNNYGWNTLEGVHCYNAASCDTAGLTMPVWEYSHSLGQSITGGFVYRGSQVPELTGKYIYADYVSGRIWALEYQAGADPVNTLLMDTDLSISSFGVDPNNELYLCAFDGKIYRFKSSPTAVGEIRRPSGNFRLAQNFPNPFNLDTQIRFYLPEASLVSLILYNEAGQKIQTWMNEVCPAGHFSRNFSANGLESGIYYLRLKTSQHVSARKLVVLK
jgi:glucose/arabinose dehydrogenase